jgi:hypothetical protein
MAHVADHLSGGVMLTLAVAGVSWRHSSPAIAGPTLIEAASDGGVAS